MWLNLCREVRHTRSRWYHEPAFAYLIQGNIIFSVNHTFLISQRTKHLLTFSMRMISCINSVYIASKSLLWTRFFFQSPACTSYFLFRRFRLMNLFTLVTVCSEEKGNYIIKLFFIIFYFPLVSVNYLWLYWKLIEQYEWSSISGSFTALVNKRNDLQCELIQRVIKKFLCAGGSIWLGQLTRLIKAVGSGVWVKLLHSLFSSCLFLLRQ